MLEIAVEVLSLTFSRLVRKQYGTCPADRRRAGFIESYLGHFAHADYEHVQSADHLVILLAISGDFVLRNAAVRNMDVFLLDIDSIEE